MEYLRLEGAGVMVCVWVLFLKHAVTGWRRHVFLSGMSWGAVLWAEGAPDFTAARTTCAWWWWHSRVRLHVFSWEMRLPPWHQEGPGSTDTVAAVSQPSRLAIHSLGWCLSWGRVPQALSCLADATRSHIEGSLCLSITFANSPNISHFLITVTFVMMICIQGLQFAGSWLTMLAFFSNEIFLSVLDITQLHTHGNVV